ncbi:MAG: hypothetical protein ACT4OM_04355 [Actinomycetota bacterium]
MSETYTAHYVRDGVTWIAEVAGHPGLRTESPSIPEARRTIREALAQHLQSDAGSLTIVEKVGLPATFRKTQEQVRATRTDRERSDMLISMTESRTAEEWGAEMDLAYRAPAAVDYLKSFGNRQINIDEMCYAISIAEQVGMYDSTRDYNSLEEVLNIKRPENSQA